MYHYDEFKYPTEFNLNQNNIDNKNNFALLKEFFQQIDLSTEHIDESKNIRENWEKTIDLILMDQLWKKQGLEEKICKIMVYNKFILNEFKKELLYPAISLIKIIAEPNEWDALQDNKWWLLCKLNINDDYYPDDFSMLCHISEKMAFKYIYPEDVTSQILNICKIYNIKPVNVKLILNLINFEVHSDNYPDMAFLFGEQEKSKVANTN